MTVDYVCTCKAFVERRIIKDVIDGDNALLVFRNVHFGEIY